MSVTLPELRARIDGLPPAHRKRFRRRLRGVAGIESSERKASALSRIEDDLRRVQEILAARQSALPPTLAYPEELPITGRREELLQVVGSHQVVIVAGETGSGKSTQLPKMCLELGRGLEGLIGHTQPRRIAARSIAERIASETRTEVGGLVGYTFRFTARVGDGTRVKVMTDGTLLADIARDRLLRRYDTIIIDEAHERSLNIDFLLGYLKRLLPRRPDLKLIVTSATIDTQRFSEYFDRAPVVEVSGRSYPVEIRYRPLGERADEADQPQAIVDAVRELFSEGNGDVLVFCSGEREIRDAADSLAAAELAHTEVVPLYARLSAREQHRVFHPHTGRRVVVATNVAETSLTVPGIRYVVDAGTARISRFGRRSKVQRLPIEPISRASADQRAGRCGRVAPGICMRLYSEEDYQGRPEFTEPEIQRTNVASVILRMAALDVGDIEDFPFLDPPDRRQVRDGLALLEELGAIDPGAAGTRQWLTPIGRSLSELPIDLRFGRMIIEAGRMECLREVLIIAAALSIQDPRERPEEKREHADQLHRRFQNPASDLLSWLQLWDHVAREQRARTSGAFRRMCRDEFLHPRRVREWQDLYAQLRQAAHDLGMFQNRRPADPDTIHRAILTGLVSHVGTKDPDGHEYRGARGTRFWIFPGSGLFKKSPDWVMAGELVETSRTWARHVAEIDPAWVEEAAPQLVRRSYSEPWWDAERGASYVHETVTVHGLPLVTDRRVLHWRVDPAGAREVFIRQALVAGEWHGRHGFVERNSARMAEVAEREARLRRVGLLADDERLYEAYDRRIPVDVVSVRHFDSWWKSVSADHPDGMDLDLAELTEPDAPEPDEAEFPTTWSIGDLGLPLSYEFEPGSASDGLTADLPIWGLERVDPARFDWLVPGMRVELIEALIRTMPKAHRKPFVPIPDTARDLARRVGPDDGALIPVLRRELTRLGGVPIPHDALDPSRLPTHLRPRFRIVDGDDVLAEGPDLEAVAADLRERARAVAAPSVHELERSGLTVWDIDELPEAVEVGEPPATTLLYPALVDDGDAVSVRLLASPAAAFDATWDGVRRLIHLSLPSPGRLLRNLLSQEGRRLVGVGPHGSVAEWAEDCLVAALDQVMLGVGSLPRTRAGFEILFARTRDDLADVLDEVAENSLRVLEAFDHVRATAAGTSALDRHPDVLADVSEQVAQLVFPGLVASLGAARLADAARYLQAIVYRLERFADNPGRDLTAMQTIRNLESDYDRLRDAVTGSDDLAEVAWMLQELRVSVFAQPIGAKGPVSEKRIRRMMEAALQTEV